MLFVSLSNKVIQPSTHKWYFWSGMPTEYQVQQVLFLVLFITQSNAMCVSTTSPSKTGLRDVAYFHLQLVSKGFSLRFLLLHRFTIIYSF